MEEALTLDTLDRGGRREGMEEDQHFSACCGPGACVYVI